MKNGSLSRKDIHTPNGIAYANAIPSSQSRQPPQPDNANLCRRSRQSMSSPHQMPVSSPESANRTPPSMRWQPETLRSAPCGEHNVRKDSAEQVEESNDHNYQIQKLDAGRLRNPLQDLLKFQENVARLRLLVQERRTALRMKRLQVSENDRLFMDELYRWWRDGRGEDYYQLTQLYDQCQEARREIGPAEDDFERLELQLGEVEYAQTKEIRRLTMALPNSASNVAYNDLGDSASSDSHISFESTTSSRSRRNRQPKENIETRMTECQAPSRSLTSLALLQHEETLSGSSMLPPHRRNEKQAVKSTRYHDVEDAQFSFNGVRTVENELSAIWNPLPPQHGLTHFSERGLLSRSNDQAPQSSYDEDDVLHSFDPGLQPDLASLLFLDDEADSQSTLSDYLLEFRNPHNRVNRWLLHRLRTSYTEAMSLKQAVSEIGVVDVQWPRQALDLWEKDDAAMPPVETSLTELTGGDDPVARLKPSSLQQRVRARPFDRRMPRTLPSLGVGRTHHPTQAFNRVSDLPIFLWTAVLERPESLEDI